MKGLSVRMIGDGGGEVEVRFKPLTYFCFDRMEDEAGDVDTVAMTCPKTPLTKERKIHKCCPPGIVSFKLYSYTH